jgi:hypothetical protein
MFYAISPDGLAILSYKRKNDAMAKATEIGGHFASDATESDTGLTALPSPMLVTIHNLIRPEKPVTRFSDRTTGEKRLKGVLEVLAKPGAPVETVEETVVEEEKEEEFIPDPALSAEENEVARAAKKSARKSGAKKTAKKSTGTRKPREAAATISDATVKKVIKLRAAGTGWPEILKELGEKSSTFIQRVRPLMKAIDKSSVKKMGPGSPNYGKGGKKK